MAFDKGIASPFFFTFSSWRSPWIDVTFTIAYSRLSAIPGVATEVITMRTRLPS